MSTPGPLPTAQAEQAPVLERHDHLPAVPAQRLQAQALRETFARWRGEGAAGSAAAWLPERAGEQKKRRK